MHAQGGTGWSWTVLHRRCRCCSAPLCRGVCRYAKLHRLCLHQCFSGDSQLPNAQVWTACTPAVLRIWGFL